MNFFRASSFFVLAPLLYWPCFAKAQFSTYSWTWLATIASDPGLKHARAHVKLFELTENHLAE